MAQFEFEFSEQDRQLIVGSDVGVFEGMDYVRLTIYPTEAPGNIVTLPGSGNKAIFFSSLNAASFFVNTSPFNQALDQLNTTQIGGSINNGKGGDFKIYQNPNGQIYIKPNEIFNDFELPDGEYKVQIDFLNQLSPPLTATADTEDDEEAEESEVQEQNQPYNFTIKEISTSRKEVRIKLLSENITNEHEVITQITNLFNLSNANIITDKYQFRYFLNIGTGDHIPITNYLFDKVTTGKDNQSIILRLYDTIPPGLTAPRLVSLEREVLTTQVEDIRYFSDVPDVYFGQGLEPDYAGNYEINPDGENNFENYDVLSASISTVVLDSLVSESQYNYPNLNTDFRFFENHTFFGSAAKKLENFKTKVETIQGHYTNISKSLNVSCSFVVDSDYTVQTRKNLFKKINKEIQSFTPYERFLYYDGQSESTASAPGLGKNYAAPMPLQDNSTEESNQYAKGEYLQALQGHDGFDTVYQHSTKNAGGSPTEYISITTGKYPVHQPPFSGYSGSVYLSFLCKGDSGSRQYHSSAGGYGFTFSNSQLHTYLWDEPFPYDSKMKGGGRYVLNPSRTETEYRRYVFHTSHSYWIPAAAVGYDIAELEADDFQINSSKVEILNTTTKTGSNAIKDSSGKYSNYMTVVTASGVPIKGSVMPAGDLFPIVFDSKLSGSLEGYLNIDNQTSASSAAGETQTSGSALTDTNIRSLGGYPASSGTGSATINGGGAGNEIFISDGVVHPTTKRKYGKSLLFISESTHELRFKKASGGGSNNYQFSKRDNFSFSIWAKRFHPNVANAKNAVVTGSADSTNILVRGSTTPSYGIMYHERQEKIFAGVRGESDAEIAASYQLSGSDGYDDKYLLDWHHIAFSYQSGSLLKLYVDGVLRSSASVSGNFLTQATDDFSGSASTVITMGGDNVLGGNGHYFNGYLQYPRIYDKVLTDWEVQQLYLSPDGEIDTKITDVKVTLKNPIDILPFDNIYKTTSTEWTNWYNGMHASASAFDVDNIHSFENNLPSYIQESSDYNDMKDFLNLQGEQYDVIRNHIDSMGTIHKRGYDKTDSPPENVYPMLLNNMGWEAINPFINPLSSSLGPYLSGVLSTDGIKSNTWKKTLNNLVYIYKSKGTKNAVRGLLNTYGYPPDIINFQEFGGNTGQIIANSPGYIKNTPPSTGIDTDLSLITGSVQYTSNTKKLYRYMFSHRNDRILNLDWWMDSADINSFEFIHKHNNTTQTQTILKSSGSAAQNLWDLRLIPSSDGASSSFQFRLNNSLTGSLAIATNAYSMSTEYNNMSDGDLWNVMLQRMTSSTSTNITNEYRLHASLQKDTSIQKYAYVTMSLSGSGTTGDKSALAHKNFMGSGSRHALSSSNLVVGETFSGSISQIKTWSTPLSTSKFRQHTLNKFSTAGNSIDSYRKELVYHFKLNENYISSSISSSAQTMKIVDSAPKTTLTTDYSFTKAGNIFTSSVYGFDFINVVGLVTEDNVSKPNNNSIIVNPISTEVVGNLNPYTPAIKSLTDKTNAKPKIITSQQLEIYRSPQTFINDFILDTLSGFNLETLYGNTFSYYSQSYENLDTFKENFYNAYPIEVDTNKFIRAHENMFNHSITEGLKKLVPARSTFSGKDSDIGVEIKPTILEKQKYENKQHSIEVNPNSPSGSIKFIENNEFKQTSLSSSLESVKTGSILIKPSVNKIFKTTTSATKANFSITFSASISNDSRITLTAFDSSNNFTTKTYAAQTSSANGSLSGSFVIFATGSGTNASSSAARNFLAAVTSSNGHGSKFTVSTGASTSGLIRITQSVAGLEGNTAITYGDSITSSLAGTLPTHFAGGTDFNKRLINAVETRTPISFTSSIEIAHSQSISFGNEYQTSSMGGDSNYRDNQYITPSFLQPNGYTASIVNPYSASFEYSETKNHYGSGSKTIPPTFSGSLVVFPTSGSIDYASNANKSFVNIHNSWGIGHTSGSNTHFIHYPGGTGSRGDYNNAHIDDRYHFIAVGDCEFYSGSNYTDSGPNSYQRGSDFADHRNFYNKTMITDGPAGNVFYQHLHSATGLTHGTHALIQHYTFNGLFMGKTRFFRNYVDADGTQHLAMPRNHVSNYSYPFKEKMYEGTQNIDPGILPVHQEDYGTASFYSVKVTGGENEAIVKGGSPVIGSDGSITYDR